MAILKKGMNAAVARNLFRQDHGGRAIGLDRDAIEREWDASKNIPQNRASTMAEKMQEGAQGEWNKLIGPCRPSALPWRGNGAHSPMDLQGHRLPIRLSDRRGSGEAEAECRYHAADARSCSLAARYLAS